MYAEIIERIGLVTTTMIDGKEHRFTLDLTIGLKSSKAASSPMLNVDDDGVDGGAQDVDVRCRRPAASP